MKILVKNAVKRKKGYMYYIDSEGNLVQEKFRTGKKKPKKKKLWVDKSEKEELELKAINSKMEMAKTELDRYVKTIVRYAFLDSCTSGAFYNNMFEELYFAHGKMIREAKISKKEKDILRMESMFGIPVGKKSKVDIAKENLEYQKKLINWAKYMLGNLNNKQKEKIIRDCIHKEELWSMQFDANWKLGKKLKAMKVNK